MRALLVCAALLAMGFAAQAQPAQSSAAKPAPMDDAEVKQAIIELSIATYPANCPCPYSPSRTSNWDGSGRYIPITKVETCGRNSAYHRMGEFAPVCFENDISPNMIRQYRAMHGG